VQGAVASPNVATLQNLYSSVDPGGLSTAEISMLNTNLRFADSLMSCRSGDGVRPDVTEDECAWGRIGDLHFAQGNSQQTVGFTENTEGLSTGFERALGNAGNKHTFIGSALSFDTGNIGSQGLSTMSGDRVQAGLDAKYQWGEGTIFGASLIGGFADYNTDRYVIGFPTVMTATGKDDMDYAGAHLRLAHVIGLPSASFEPYVDAGWSRLNVEPFNEVGAGAFDAQLAGHGDTFYTIQPGFEFAGQFKSGDALVRPALDFSVQNFIGNNQADAFATLYGAPQGVTPFVSGSQFDRTLFDVSPGIEVFVPHGLDLRFGSAIEFGAHTHSSSFFLRLSQKIGAAPK
jgi:outer membrane autotransporter protein